MIPKKKLNKIGDKIEDLKHIVRIIKNKMDGAIQIIEKYYYIANDIIKKYETFNSKSKNYQTLLTINYLSSSNKEILKQIESIIEGNKSKEDWLKKCAVLLDIIEGDRSEYNNAKTEENENEDISNNEIKNNIYEGYDFDSNQDFEKISSQTNNTPSNSRRISQGKNKNNKNKQKVSMLNNKSNLGNK